MYKFFMKKIMNSRLLKTRLNEEDTRNTMDYNAFKTIALEYRPDIKFISPRHDGNYIDIVYKDGKEETTKGLYQQVLQKLGINAMYNKQISEMKQKIDALEQYLNTETLSPTQRGHIQKNIDLYKLSIDNAIVIDPYRRRNGTPITQNTYKNDSKYKGGNGTPIHYKTAYEIARGNYVNRMKELSRQYVVHKGDPVIGVSVTGLMSPLSLSVSKIANKQGVEQLYEVWHYIDTYLFDETAFINTVKPVGQDKIYILPSLNKSSVLLSSMDTVYDNITSFKADLERVYAKWLESMGTNVSEAIDSRSSRYFTCKVVGSPNKTNLQELQTFIQNME